MFTKNACSIKDNLNIIYMKHNINNINSLYD